MMLRFKEFLAEAFLIEGKIDDLKAQNPSLHHEIDAYVAADTSATKKFLPWLVGQHKRGNVTPDNPDLRAVIQNFDRYKSIHGIKDHSSRSFQDVRDAVLPHVGKGATKTEIAHDGREKIHDSGNVQAYHIQTKEASQHFYGGGKELGGDHTSWCVSARSSNCRFGQYGKMYTIHVNDDPNSPYAVHPEKNTITTRHNDGDRNIDREIQTKPSIARLKPVLDKIKQHHDPMLERLRTVNISDHEIDNVMNGSNELYAQTLQSNKNPRVVLTALNHPKIDRTLTRRAAQHPNPEVAMAALNHPKADISTLHTAAQHPNPEVAMAALNHPKADKDTVFFATRHPDPQVALTALNHPKGGILAIAGATTNTNSQVALTALKHPDVSADVTYDAVRHPDPQVALAALYHPKANWLTANEAEKHKDPQVRAAAKIEKSKR